jgi:c-di-GMP-binding flagellar brake protein YcgR
VLNNGTQLTILLPHRISPLTGRSESLAPGEWKDREISVYFWRKGDAGYAFDSKVLGSGFYRSDNALFLMHSRKLDRTQKRQSIRCKCEIYGKMFFTDGKPESSYRIESSVGYKCLIEDISEDGALIRIGGKCKSGTAIKIQFEINGSLVVMHGVIRAVEWNKTMNQSRLHFECMKIDRGMKNTVLTFVYNVLPPEEKQIHEAIAQAESAEREAAQVVIHKEEFEEF